MPIFGGEVYRERYLARGGKGLNGEKKGLYSHRRGTSEIEECVGGDVF